MRYCNPRIASVLLLALACYRDACHADIYRWDTGTLLPGTRGIELWAGVLLNNRTLDYADLSNIDLSSANFSSSDLTKANFTSADLSSATLQNTILSGANFLGAKLIDANLRGATLANAELARAAVTGTNFSETTSKGFSKWQLYSTASYITKDLHGIELWGNDLNGWNFSGQNLTDASFFGSTLTNATFAGANLTRASFGDATLSNADLTGADFTGASLYNATLTNATLSGAVVAGASFPGAGSRGLTEEQLYSTASYKVKNLRGIGLQGIASAPFFNNPAAITDLTGWDFRGQDLSGANLGLATLTRTDLTGAVVKGASFAYSTSKGFTKEQLYSTASYQAGDLAGIWLHGNDLTGWNFAGQNLTDATFGSSTFLNADVSGADLSSADTRGARGFNLAEILTRNTILPDGKIAGLDVATGERVLVRDDDGVPNTPQPSPLPTILADMFYLQLAPRPPIPVAVQDRLSMADGSVLQLQFDADNWDSLISFEPSIPVDLGGALELTFVDDVAVATQVGRTLRIFDWTGVSPDGNFKVRSPYVWNVSNLYTTGEVTLVAVPEPSASSLLVGVLLLAACRGFRAHKLFRATLFANASPLWWLVQVDEGGQICRGGILATFGKTSCFCTPDVNWITSCF